MGSLGFAWGDRWFCSPDVLAIESKHFPWRRSRILGNDLLRTDVELANRSASVLPGRVVRGRRNPLHFGFPARLAKARRGAGLSLTELGDRAGIGSAKTASALERGVNAPRLSTIVRLAAVLGVQPGWLAYGTVEQAAPLGELTPSTLAVRLRTIRLAQGLSLRQLGARSGTSGNLVSQIEQGSDPAIDTLERIAAALAIPVAWLGFGGPPGRAMTSEAPSLTQSGPNTDLSP